MTHIELTQTVGPDGVLTLSVPVGPENANRDVKVTIEPIGAPSARPRLTQEEWQRFIDATAGKWQGEPLVRSEQPPLEDAEWQRFIDATAGSIVDPTFQRHAQEGF